MGGSNTAQSGKTSSITMVIREIMASERIANQILAFLSRSPIVNLIIVVDLLTGSSGSWSSMRTFSWGGVSTCCSPINCATSSTTSSSCLSTLITFGNTLMSCLTVSFMKMKATTKLNIAKAPEVKHGRRYGNFSNIRDVSG
eukprot:Lithocolla_globosa_v1_NODE_2325_length_2047_cov_13.879518.p2 type:complete len:142 gc:universal NODE_2325_length_2047_cov_13.879518:838-1263(+)